MRVVEGLHSGAGCAMGTKSASLERVSSGGGKAWVCLGLQGGSSDFVEGFSELIGGSSEPDIG